MTTDRVTPLLRGALVPTLAVGGVSIIVSAVVAGGRGALGALIGAATAVIFSGVGFLAVRAVRSTPPATLMLVALSSYLLRVLFFGIILEIVGSIDGVDSVIHRGATALTVVACVLAGMAGEIWAYTRLRVPTYDLDEPAAHPVDPGRAS
ncbi:hypothetical protein [Actinopolymorpha alba]|uniref:hypothetical protein n=1 Tax=Actinopolymorpha alba TaxID=533267 RepID=UPI00037F039D|nr:hypothetical protein [Actinopolymorpha alba]